MSIIFGLVRERGGYATEEEMRRMGRATSRHAREGSYVKTFARAGMGFQPYATHARSNIEMQPECDSAGNVALLDGRLDNYQDLCDLLGLKGEGTSDSKIVLASYTRWGDNCFARFVGDWAIAIWSSRDETLYLARDHAGTRTLYFKRTNQAILFATFLDTLVGDLDNAALDETYAAQYLALMPTGDRTPYKDVTAVRAAHVLIFQETKLSLKSHWESVVTDRIAYKTDTEYEEHFFDLFHRSVLRRTGPSAPILAQLSGGMDSSSIVCMSDSIKLNEGSRVEDLLDTISYFDDTEPDWNERPYFTAVEQRRGKMGIHIDVSKHKRSFECPGADQGLYLVPGGDSSTLMAEHKVGQIIESRGYKVILSGIGGDELLGGIPTVVPQLADLAVSGKLLHLLRLAVASCLEARTPLALMLYETALFLVSLRFPNMRLSSRPKPPWMTPSAKHHLRTAPLHPRRRRVGASALPSSIAAGNMWWKLLETMPHLNPRYHSRYEYRYPFLDRDLVDFLLRIPEEQLVRPGRRRSLMRRALKTILPQEVLERRRKGYLSRTLGVSLSEREDQIRSMLGSSELGVRGLVDTEVLKRELDLAVSQSSSAWVPAIVRAAFFEVFLRSLRNMNRTSEA